MTHVPAWIRWMAAVAGVVLGATFGTQAHRASGQAPDQGDPGASPFRTWAIVADETVRKLGIPGRPACGSKRPPAG